MVSFTPHEGNQRAAHFIQPALRDQDCRRSKQDVLIVNNLPGRASSQPKEPRSLCSQNSASMMGHGDVVRAGHYMVFLEAIDSLTRFKWQVAPPSGGGACTPAAPRP
jgi:hypothetical protein